MKIPHRSILDIDQQVYEWLDFFELMKSRPGGHLLTLGWMPNLLKHVYGSEAAIRMFRERGIA